MVQQSPGNSKCHHYYLIRCLVIIFQLLFVLCWKYWFTIRNIKIKCECFHLNESLRHCNLNWQHFVNVFWHNWAFSACVCVCVYCTVVTTNLINIPLSAGEALKPSEISHSKSSISIAHTHTHRAKHVCIYTHTWIHLSESISRYQLGTNTIRYTARSMSIITKDTTVGLRMKTSINFERCGYGCQWWLVGKVIWITRNDCGDCNVTVILYGEVGLILERIEPLLL